MPVQVGYLLDKLYKIDKALGGTASAQKGSADEFTNIKDAILERLHTLRKKLDEKEKKGRSADGVRLNVEIKDLVGEVEQLLGKLNEVIRKQAKDKKKFTEQNIQQKQKMYENLRQQINDVQTIIDPNSSSGDKFEQVETVTDMKSRLMEKGGRPAKQAQRSEANAEEKAAMDRWKQNDAQMDKQLDQIIDGTAQWKENAIKIGAQIDHTMDQITKLDVEVDKTNEQLMASNKSLKKIVDEYRKPNKFCMDIVLIIILLGLAGAIYSVM